MSYSYAASRIIAGILISVTNAEITPRLTVLLFLLAAPLLAVPVTTASTLTAFGVGLMVLIATQARSVWAAIPAQVRASPAEVGEREWRGRSVKMWMAGLLNTLVQTLDVVLLGVLIDPVLAGAYFAASRLANVMAKVTDGINVYATRKIAHLYFGRSHDELQRVLRSLAAMTGVLVAIAGAALVMFGDLLLGMFGETYVSQVPTLLVLVVGTGGAALGGPARYLLLQTGHESVCLWTTVTALAARVVLLIALAPVFGALGAAIAWTVTEVLTVIALNIACRRLVGADPSVFSLVRAA